METTILIQSALQPNAINPQPNDGSHKKIKIGSLASEIFVFEIVDGRRTTDAEVGRTPTDACLSYKLTCEPSAQMN